MSTLYVSEPGAKLKKEDQRIIITKGEDVLDEIPLVKLDQVVMMGRSVSISTPLMFELLNRGVDVVYLSRTGKFISRLENESHNNVKLRYNQILRANDPEFSLSIAKQFILGKISNQQTLIQRQNRGRLRPPVKVEGIQKQKEQIQGARDAESLRGMEGTAARVYFDGFRQSLIAPITGGSWNFHRREYYPAPDPINSMLSFGYTLLTREMHSTCHRVGLDPFVGFFHTLDFGKPSLALDLMEEFRPILIDSMVMNLVNHHSVKQQDFQIIPVKQKQMCKMSDEFRRKLIETYEKRMNEVIRYPINHQQNSYRQILLLQARQLSGVITGKVEKYQPFLAN